jgi:glycosyltransferase involved in cell wall biosynthesis
VDGESDLLLPDAIIASTDGNFLERAERVAGAIRASGADAILYHAGFHEQITARVAAFRPGPVQVNVAYGVQMDADLFDGFILQTKQGVAAGHHSTARREWIPPGCDIADRLRACPENMRQVMGLESANTVSATVGDFQHMSDPKYLYVLTGILKSFPDHFHLFSGTGDVKTIRAALHEEGVLPRVRFLGTMSDTASVMAVADVYLCPFKKTEEFPLLDAMGAGRACVAVKFPDDAGRNVSAEILGVPELLVEDSELAYLQVVQGLLRDAETRARCAQLVEARFEAEFSSLNLGRKYLEFLVKLGTDT